MPPELTLLPAVPQNREGFINYSSELYPVSELATNLGLEVVSKDTDVASLVYVSDWAPVGIRKGSPLAAILEAPPIRRLLFVRQLGPNAMHPYPYTHTSWHHTAEQLLHGVRIITELAEKSPELFSEGTEIYNFGEATPEKHVGNIALLVALVIAFHDAESPALRDTMKFALKNGGTVTDENTLLAKRLKDPNDSKYRSIIKLIKNLGLLTPQFANEVPEIIGRIVTRKEEGPIADLLHAKASEDKSDPNGKSKPLDIDRIVYTLQDLVNVFRSDIFDPDAGDKESEYGLLFLGGSVLYKILNLNQFRMQVDSLDNDEAKAFVRKLFMPRKIRPEFLDVSTSFTLARDKKGKVMLALKDATKLGQFLEISLFDNLVGMYLTPAMIFTERRLEDAFKANKDYLKQSLGISSDQDLVEFFLGLGDYEAIQLLEQFVPAASAAISDNSYQDFYYAADFLEPHHIQERAGKNNDYITAEVHLHAGTSTRVINDVGLVEPLCEAYPEIAAEIQIEVNRFRYKKLVIVRKDNRNNPFLRSTRQKP